MTAPQADSADTTPPAPDPVVRVGDARELAPDVMLIPDHSVPLVPNIGVIGGRDAVLVVDTGLGNANAQAVFDYATRYASGRRMYLTTTHFHPEHASGAAVFAGHATYVINHAQADELADKAGPWLQMFATLGEPVTGHTDQGSIAVADIAYDDPDYALDLGGRVVQLHATGRAHTRGDQVVTVPDVNVMFTGDLVESGQFAIFPWLPGHDTDVSGQRWLAVIRDLIARGPQIVVPGHGPAGGVELLQSVADYLQLVWDQTNGGQQAGADRVALIEHATTLAVQAHPDWTGREWIASAVDSMLSDLNP